MLDGKTQEDATLLDVLIDGFEKNEVLIGGHHRDLPMPSEIAAARKFAALVEEGTRWKGAPLRSEERSGRRLAAWHDLEIRQAGRGILVLVKPPRFPWWHLATTWSEDPMGQVSDWVTEEYREGESGSG